MTSSANDADACPPSPERVAEMVRSLATVMRQTAVTEIDVAFGPVSVRMRRPSLDVDFEHDVVAAGDDRASADSAVPEHVVTAPMIGTFYSAPTPGAPPFVRVGDEVVVGQTIGIIEAMKIMNEITADRFGTVTDILAGNGQPVEYGSPLMCLAIGRSERS